MLTKRQLLQAGVGVMGTGLLARTLAPSASVSPVDFGARGGGSADDTSAVIAAMRSAFERGLPVDGGDAIFGIARDLHFTGLRNPWIRSLRLKQLNPSNDRKSVHLAGCEAIRVDRIEIDVGRAPGTGYMNESGGLWIDGGSRHQLSNVDVHGDGKNSLVAIWNTNAGTYTNIRVHDCAFDDKGSRDDVMQGIWLNANANCVLQRPVVANLKGNASFRGKLFPNLRTRGIALTGNVGCSVVDAFVQDVDQGIDISGSDGNVDCSVIGGRALQCTSVGLKFANSAERCRATKFRAEKCGAQGFLISGPNEPLLRRTAQIELDECVAIDIGYNHFPTTTAGFMIQAGAKAAGSLAQYPLGVQLHACQALDSQAEKTMDYGFYTNIAQSSETKSANQLVACSSSGHRIAGRLGFWLVS